ANAEITFSLVNIQTSTSYTADLEANALYENAVYDETSFSYESAVYNEASPSCDNANAEEVKNIDDIDSYFKAYGQYSGFVVIKKWVEQRNDGVIRHRSFGCEFGANMYPRKTLDSRLEKEAKWNHFFEYKTLSLCVGIASVSSELLPAVDHILSEYLTPQILSIERIEMVQCLYFDATLANLATLIRLDGENESI
ncbi:15106_t:CDS:2, partial [Cetraspora pellucida]